MPVVEGEKTAVVMHAIAKALLPCIPGAKHVVLEGATHTIQFDAPESMARAVADYLARQAGLEARQTGETSYQPAEPMSRAVGTASPSGNYTAAMALRNRSTPLPLGTCSRVERSCNCYGAR
jgi:hypothetical protein